jgi:hypothetical protein
MKRITLILITSLIVISCGGGNTSETSPDRGNVVVERKSCRVCGKSYTGSGYQAFGQEFCSMKCYVDK